MIEEKIGEMLTKAKKLMDEGTLEEHLPEQMEFFGKEILPLLAVQGYLNGVGKLDPEAANTVMCETGRLCGAFTLAGMTTQGLEVPTTDVDAFLEAHARAATSATFLPPSTNSTTRRRNSGG